MNILALDLGTTTGWALVNRDGKVSSSSISFAPAKGDRPGQKWMLFRRFLTDTGQSVGELHAVYFEDVRNHGKKQVLAAHAYGGFLAHLQHWCELNNIPCRPLGVGQIKKHWTGVGNAKKDAMIAAAKRRGFRVVDDNHADALAILDLARAIEGGAVVLPKPVKKKPKVVRRTAKDRKAQPELFVEVL